MGAVAVDRHGNVACATSTGGISAKMVGRVGDSPIIGKDTGKVLFLKQKLCPKIYN